MHWKGGEVVTDEAKRPPVMVVVALSQTRIAWRAYAAACLADPECCVTEAAAAADKMVQEEVNRFGPMDQAK